MLSKHPHGGLEAARVAHQKDLTDHVVDVQTPSGDINPMGSMYGIFNYIWVIYGVNVGKYAIHGSSGYGFKMYKRRTKNISDQKHSSEV